MGGFEPPTPRSQTVCSSQIEPHPEIKTKTMKPAGLEPAMASLEDSCLIHLDDGSKIGHMGFEPMIFTLRE